jgi:murein DD-endopeptidase MepM/ murein hydrolase activator NlpD
MVSAMVRTASTVAVLAALAVVPAHASASGGGVSVGTTHASKPASGGSTSGGAAYGVPLLPPPPVAKQFSVNPRQLRADHTPTIVVRIDEPRVHKVSLKISFYALRGNGKTLQISGGRHKTGRRITLPWPKGVQLGAGRYRVILHAVGPHNLQLRRDAHASGRTTLTVTRVPKPQPVTTPTTTTPAPPPPAPTSGGTFPVQGPHSYGDPFGAPRKGYTHQGQDVLAALGTPVVAPLAGTIDTTGYQASSAGYYVVENASDGHAFFFAHCAHASLAVGPGQTVTQGQELCHVGQTGDATGPHLHFELWVDGWRVSSASHPIDPLPQLQAWDAG